ncbi:choline transporter-like protein 2 isoform X2 [Lingula anatina]|uniref:Choline transporter-like protein n=1 Tax=Lingula anatina TaxID=7574 RepID=A0A1S3I2H0_LINAN|nr:choline transporter-like protein 2 isoform X2 [Lingula anatina]|eukprot:XP_013392467.1 choline transporter-like protein 2 isoform X2 [Lingula anatina]
MGKDSKVDDSENAAEKSEEKNKYGEPAKFDPTFNGPIKNRGCTDVICCILFIIFFLGMGVVGYWGYKEGDPTVLIYPSDSEGNLCGYGNFVNKPNLFFFDLLKCTNVAQNVAVGCPTTQVCVSKCPDKNWVWVAAAAQDANPLLSTQERRKLKEDMYCTYNITTQVRDEKSIKELVEGGNCASYYVKSDAVVGRCVPSAISTLINSASGLLSDAGNTTLVAADNTTVTGDALSAASKVLAYILNAKEYGEKILADVRASWWMILVGLGISCVIAFIWIIIMRWIAGVIVWFTIFAFIALFSFSTYYTLSRYFEMKNNSSASLNSVTDIEFTTNLDYYWNLSTTWLVFGIISATILGLSILILLFLRNRIRIAIALIKEASRAVGNMMFTLLWPIIPFFLQVVLFGFWGATALYLASSDKKKYASSSGNLTSNVTAADSSNLVTTFAASCAADYTNSTLGQFCGFVGYDVQEYTIYLQFYMLFMLFWVMNFIIALGQLTLAGAFASYYWAFSKPQDIPAFPVTASLWRSLRYHLGSIAFGSLIIAIIQIIRVILEYVDNKLKGSENQVAKFFLKCLKCCFWCLEKFMKFLNKNAYILIAVYGKNFCTSAKNAFFLIMRNIVRVVVIDKVADFLLLIAKLVVVAATTAGAYFFFDGRISFLSNYTPSLNYYLVPVIIISLGSYVIAAAFFSVYGMGVDTLFLCFLEDCERHDGSAEKPYYMNKDLMGILGKKNKLESTEGDKKGKKG